MFIFRESYYLERMEPIKNLMKVRINIMKDIRGGESYVKKVIIQLKL